MSQVQIPRHGKRQFFLLKQSFSTNYFSQKKCVNFNKSEFRTKQGKMYLRTIMRKIRLPHFYRGKYNVLITPKNKKLQHNSLSRQNSKNLAQILPNLKKNRQALFACLHGFPSLQLQRVKLLCPSLHLHCSAVLCNCCNLRTFRKTCDFKNIDCVFFFYIFNVCPY